MYVKKINWRLRTVYWFINFQKKKKNIQFTPKVVELGYVMNADTIVFERPSFFNIK